MDNCWDYNDGISEVRMGKALARRLPRKSLPHDQDRRPHRRGVQQATRRIPQPPPDRHHRPGAVSRGHPHGRPRPHLRPGGAHRSRLDARKAGKIRYIGFTGHKDPAVHLRMLEVAQKNSFHFDTVQMPINVMDAHFRCFTKQVMPGRVKARHRRARHEDLRRPLHSRQQDRPAHRSPALRPEPPVSVVITGIDNMQILDQALEAARTFKPLSRPRSVPCSPAPPPPLPKASSNSSKPQATSTAPPRTQMARLDQPDAADPKTRRVGPSFSASPEKCGLYRPAGLIEKCGLSSEPGSPTSAFARRGGEARPLLSGPAHGKCSLSSRDSPMIADNRASV